MTQKEIDQYPIERWMQGRALFDNSKPSNSSIYYFGGHSYKWVLDSRLDKYAKVRLFDDTMKNLTHKDIYLDVGAGNGKAIKEYRQLFPAGAKVIGIGSTQPHEEAIQDVIEQDKNDEKFSFYLDDFTKFPTEALAGRVSVITDVIGAFRYGRDPAQVIRQVGKLLKEGGLVFFKFTYSDGIKVPQGYDKFVVWNRPKDSSSHLLYLWFQTIRGFDVLQEDMTLEESKAFQKEIIDDIHKVASRRFAEYAIVLRRNADQVEVDPLIIDPKVDQDVSRNKEGGIYWDEWIPAYTWEMSAYSQSMLKKPEIKTPIS